MARDPVHSDRPVVVVSNRGPVSLAPDAAGGPARARRAAGGLASGLSPLMVGTGATWIAAAFNDTERSAASGVPIEAAGFRLQYVAPDPETFRLAYDEVGNAVLWFLHHHLFDLVRSPVFDRRFDVAWDAYRSVNRSFADTVIATAPGDAVVLVQDYHLALLAPMVRAARADLSLVHFSHTPFAAPGLCTVLPDAVRRELFEGLAGNDACGFHSARWASAFDTACRAAIGHVPPTFVSPLATDAHGLARSAADAATQTAVARLAAVVGERRLVARVDRIELSKNLVRGFLAYEDLLERHPEWLGRVVFGAFVYPSRTGVPAYRTYRQEVDATVARINERFGTSTWTPIHLDASDDYALSLAALTLADVVMVNPIRDGLNLVAKEAPLLNQRDAVLLLSPEAGAWDELADAALPVHPFDITGTADTLHRALAMDPDDPERVARAARLRELAAARSPGDWLDDQLAAAEIGR